MLSGEFNDGNWFQQNPKKTLVAVVLTFLVLAVFGAEKFLGFLNHRRGIVLEAETERRYIKLREQRPGRQMRLKFPKDLLPFTDNVLDKTYKVDIDQDGFIKPSRKYSHPDLSIVFLGGSTTECMYMDELNRFPYLVGVLLENQTGRKINSYNGGLSGNNSLHSIDLLVNKVIPLKPRVVVFMENINDLTTLLYEKTYWTKNNVLAPIETLAKKKLVGKMLKELLVPNLNEARWNFMQTIFPREGDTFAKAHNTRLIYDQAAMAREFAMNLKIMADICRDRGIIPVLMTQANRVTSRPDPVVAALIGQHSQETGISYSKFKTMYDLFNDTIRQVGQNNGVLVIDLARQVPPDKEHLYDMVHFNDAGSKLAAQIIATQLQPLLK